MTFRQLQILSRIAREGYDTAYEEATLRFQLFPLILLDVCNRSELRETGKPVFQLRRKLK